MATEIRIRRPADSSFYMGYVGGQPVFVAGKKDRAHVFATRASAEALCSGEKFVGCVVEEEEIR